MVRIKSTKSGALIFFLVKNAPPIMERRCRPMNKYGYWTEGSYVGFMPDGTKRWFVSPEDYWEAFDEFQNSKE